MDNKPAEIHLELILEEEKITDDVLSELIALGPDKHWRKGELKCRPPCILVHEDNGCGFKEIQYDDEVNIRQFWDRLKSHDSLLNTIEKLRLSPFLAIAIYAYDVMPAICLDASLMGELASHGIDMDFDVYDLSED